MHLSATERLKSSRRFREARRSQGLATALKPSDLELTPRKPNSAKRKVRLL